MKVFISWSGEPSKALAEALRDWLPLVLHYVDPWMSDVDIDAGDRWADSVAKELEASNFGIICVTQENIDSSWILFEAGALAKSMNGGRVIPLLLDLDFQDISGPLAQFQAKKLEKDGMAEVIQSISQAADRDDDQNRSTQLFDALWPKLEALVGNISTEVDPVKATRPQADVLEELVASIRTLDGRVRDMPSSGARPRRRKTPKQVMLQADLAQMAMDGPGDPLGILVLASTLKDDLPWLFELGVEAYRSAIQNAPHANREAHRFMRGVDALRYSGAPIKQLDLDPRMIEFLADELLVREVSTRGQKPDPVEDDLVSEDDAD